MEIKNLILIIVAVLNFFIGLVVILKNHKSHINLSFGLFLLSVVGWSIGLAMSRELAGTLEALHWGNSTYYFGALIAIFFLYFSFIFPFQKKKFTFFQKFLIILPFLFILFILMKGDLLIKGMTVKPWGYDVTFGKFWYLIYSIYFIAYMLWAYLNIWKSYLTASGYIKFQLKFILISLIVAGFFGMVFDLILPYFGYWKLNWFGPYFSIFVLFSISYLVFFKDKLR